MTFFCFPCSWQTALHDSKRSFSIIAYLWHIYGISMTFSRTPRLSWGFRYTNRELVFVNSLAQNAIRKCLPDILPNGFCSRGNAFVTVFRFAAIFPHRCASKRHKRSCELPVPRRVPVPCDGFFCAVRITMPGQPSPFSFNPNVRYLIFAAVLLYGQYVLGI